MPEITRTKFNSPWTVAVIEAALNDVSSAKGSSESLTAALNAMRAEINSLSGGVHLKGAVDYYNDLPASPSEGDAYTVRYQGTSGTDPLGIEYAWATYQGTPQWIPIGVDPSVFAKQTEMDVVANAGAKNFAKTTTVSFTTSTQIELSPITGIVVFSARNIASDDTSASQCAVVFNYSDGTSSEKMLINRGDNVSAEKTLGKTATMATIYASDTTAHSTGKTATFTDLMIRSAAITDPTFQPYAKTNRELTVLTDEDRAALVEILDGGAKNLSRWNSGTSTSAEPTLAQQIPFTSDGGEYTISYNTDLTTGTLYIGFKDSGGAATLTVEIGNANKVKTITIPANTAYFNVYAPAYGDYSNFMICTAADWAVSQKFVPYCPTNRELYESKLTADGVWGLGTELSANTDLNVVTDIGRYFCTGSSVGSTLENCPTIQPFVLTVSAFQDVNNKIQRIESLNLSNLAVEIYERMKISSGWKSWYKFGGTAVT